MKYRLLSVIFISFLFSGCTALGTIVSNEMFESERLEGSGQFQKCINHILGPNGTMSSPENANRIMAENIRILSDKSISFKSFYIEFTKYMHDLRFLTRSQIELGHFQDAKLTIEKGMKNCQLLSDAAQNNPNVNKSVYKLIIDTQLYLHLYKGYVTWFESGQKAKADKYFLPVEKICEEMNFDEDYSFTWRYNDRKSIGQNLGTATDELLEIPFRYLSDTTKGFFINIDQIYWYKILIDRASYYSKIHADYNKSLFYLNKAIEVGKDNSILHLDAEYYSLLLAYIKMIMINIQVGNLENASQLLDSYNSLAGNFLVKIGSPLLGIIDDFKGLIVSFNATGGALYALSRDFEKSKEYFDKAYDYLKSIDENTEDQNKRYGMATYYVYLGAYYHGLQNQYEKAAEYVDKGLSFITPFYIFSIHNDLDIETAYVLSGEIHLKIANQYKENKDSESAKEHYRIAMERAKESEKHAKKYHNKVGMSRALSLMGWVKYYQGKNKSARGYFRKALRKVRGIENTDNWNIFYGAGRAYEAMGNAKRAIANYKLSVKEIEKLWDGRFKDTYKQLSFIEDRLAVFEPLIRLLVKTKEYTQAVGYMERSKSRSFYESSPYYSRGNVQDAKWQNVKPLTVSQIIKMLPPDTAILEYYVGKEDVVGGVIGRKSKYPYLKKLNISADELEKQMNGFRDAIELPAVISDEKYKDVRSEKMLESIDTICNSGNSLYKSLVKPFEKKLSGYKHICIIPHGILHYLPFQALTKTSACLDKNRFRNSFQIAKVLRGTEGDAVSSSEKLDTDISTNNKGISKTEKTAFLIEDYTISYAPIDFKKNIGFLI